MYNIFLILELNRCKTWQAVDTAFDKRKIKDFKKRMNYLGRCMGNPQVFFGGKEKEDREEEFRCRYVTMRSMFLTGSWR